MATQRKADQAPPPYYIADEPLFIEHVRAHNPGDQVPVDHVERYGWADLVHAPDDDKPKKTEPETDGGQATTRKEGA
jgi:hypothetical protein